MLTEAALGAIASYVEDADDEGKDAASAPPPVSSSKPAPIHGGRQLKQQRITIQKLISLHPIEFPTDT